MPSSPESTGIPSYDPRIEADAYDEATLREWRAQQVFAPVRGRDGGGGFIGWANRLDDRVNRRSGGKLFKSGPQVPIRQRDLWREMVSRPLLYWTILWLLYAVVLIALEVPLSGTLALLPFLPILYRAQARVRARRVAEIRQELAATSGAGPDPKRM